MNVTKDDVRAARVAAGLSQPAAAALVGMHRWQTWQEWELGVHPANVPTYRLFCHLAGLERIPFGTIQPERKSAEREAAELDGKIAEMLRPKAVRKGRQR
jgi:transcriptional regulator with XRE-family HTH domain